MIRLDFSTETIEQLRYEKRYHPHPRVRQKMEALYLKSQGLPHQKICALVGIRGRATLVRYLKEYASGGLEPLAKVNFRRPTSELIEHREAIEQAIREQPPATINAARHLIEPCTGLQRSNTSIRKFLKKHRVKALQNGFDTGEANGFRAPEAAGSIFRTTA